MTLDLDIVVFRWATEVCLLGKAILVCSQMEAHWLEWLLGPLLVCDLQRPPWEEASFGVRNYPLPLLPP